MTQKQYVTILGDSYLVDKVKNHYKDDQKENNNEYIVFFAKRSDLIVAIYSSKKDDVYKIIFSGSDPLKEALKFDKNAKLNEKKEKTAPKKASWIFISNQIGSDEVGTGDLFGPICVAGAYIKKEDITTLKALKIDDSKRLSDEDILKLGEKLINLVDYSQVSLNNEKYNELIDKNINMNEMKVKLHNQVLLNLKKRHPDVDMFFVDQFLESDKYFDYLKDTDEVVKNINFKTKGESYFPCVAVASIIARYSFLKKMEQIKEKYQFDIPFGASAKVTKAAEDFAKAYGRSELAKIVKKNFVNVKDIL